MMFPEIMRDEVFRIETARLWLRWPTVADEQGACDWLFGRADELGTVSLSGAGDVGKQTLGRWSAENESGRSHNLLIAPKATPQTAIGFIRIGPGSNGAPLLTFGLDPLWRGHALMTEAAETLIDMVFRITALPEIAALPRSDDSCGRRLLERVGFRFEGAARQADAAMSLSADRFVLERSTWVQQQQIGYPTRITNWELFGAIGCA